MADLSRMEFGTLWAHAAVYVPGWAFAVEVLPDYDGIKVAYLPGPDNPCDSVEAVIPMIEVRKNKETSLKVIHELAEKARSLHEGVPW